MAEQKNKLPDREPDFYLPIFSAPYLKGWRIFSKTSLTEPEIAMLIKEMERFDKITSSELKDYIGEEKSNLIKAELEKIKLEY